MSLAKVFIDGQAGTTGLEIYERLQNRKDIELLIVDEALRKDDQERSRLMNEADLVFLCLPDLAAIEAVKLVTNPKTKIIDASTAHRTNSDWTYGFAELSKDNYQAIQKSKRVANPGCHATGFISIVYPLIQLGILADDTALTSFSITGYSGGGKQMIQSYEQALNEDKESATLYKLDLNHKHIPEMMFVTGLKKKPLFVPILDHIYRGMSTSVGLHTSDLLITETVDSVFHKLSDYYKDSAFISVSKMPENQLLPTSFGKNTNQLEITVSGNDEQILLTARFDNLGKGASGAAVQNMNIMLGLDEKMGL